MVAVLLGELSTNVYLQYYYTGANVGSVSAERRVGLIFKKRNSQLSLTTTGNIFRLSDSDAKTTFQVILSRLVPPHADCVQVPL